MKRLILEGRTGRSEIRIGASARRLGDYAPKDRTLIVTDRKVYGLYRPLFRGWDVLILDRGEKTKTLAVVERIERELLRKGYDRGATLVGAGGGVVCDLAGFAASVYMRGIRFGFVPTTLLAQVDASLGGKNGVNLDRFKNVIGVFRQPDFVLSDPRFLATLPAAEIRNGLAETVKAAAIRDRELFGDLEADPGRALAGDPEILGRMIERAAAVKIGIVARDERECGPRALLNFGHTLGHALEKTAGISHGAAVSIGMAAAARLSTAEGLLPEREARRLIALLDRLGLPTGFPSLSRRVLAAIDKDKKKDRRLIRFVMLRRIGSAVIRPVRLENLKEALHDLR
ncbi:MAG: 3-dehydroquinate synthase [Candidatus Aminicenantales bacterium]